VVKQVLAHISTNKWLRCFFWLFVILFNFISDQYKRKRVKRWSKLLNLDERYKIFQQLYQDVDGFLISQQARQFKNALDYTYGEIEFLPFIALLSLVKLDNATVFYDLGSGVGKAVISCALVYPVKKSVGVELFSALHQCALKTTERLRDIKNHEALNQKIHFIEGDFLNVDIEEATIIFINATTLFNPTWGLLCARINKLNGLKTVITTSKPLIAEHFTLHTRTQIQMSWGMVFAYIHIRKN